MFFLPRGLCLADCLLPTILLMIWVPALASAVELVVDNVRGSDLQGPPQGARTSTPYRTIQRAVEHASVGDTISIRNTGEPYRECVSINSNHQLGTPIFPLIIEGNGATLDGTRPLGVLDWTAIGQDLFELNVRSPGHVTLIAADDQPHPENLGHRTDLSALQPLQYARNLGAVFFRARPGEVPQAYGLRVGIEQSGLTLYDVSHIVIRNLNVVGFRLDGINCHDLVSEVRFENIVSEKNGRSGISVGGASQVVLQTGRLRQNIQSQARSEGWGKLELIDVAIEPGAAKAIDQAGGRVVESR
jgi:hypothetical protein